MKPARQPVRSPARRISASGTQNSAGPGQAAAAELAARSDRCLTQTNIFQTRDMDDARQHMGAIFRSHNLRLARGGKLRMEHETVRVGRLSAHWLGYGSGVTMSAPEMDRFHLFQFNLQGGCVVANGSDAIKVEGGSCYAVNPDRPLSKTWDENCRQFILRIDRDCLDAFAAQETGVDAARRLAFDFRPVLIPCGFGDVVRSIAAQREAAAGGLGHFRVARHLETMLMSLMLASFPHSLRQEFDRAAQPCAPYYVRRAEQYIHAHARDVVGIDDLVAAAGVSTRSLFAGFKRFRDTTPMAHIKAVRLELARADLASADPAHSTVTEIAINCGFTHMGRFAQDFKARYGATPAKMLGQRQQS